MVFCELDGGLKVMETVVLVEGRLGCTRAPGWTTRSSTTGARLLSR
jgi:hypothetical protein